MPWPISNYDSNIVTPIRAEILDQYLQGYSQTKREFLVDGFINGFQIPFECNIQFRDCRNLLSARKLPHILKEKIIFELKAKRVVGPFYEPPFQDFTVSPLGLVPKKEEGEFRVIHHLSFPEGASVNDGISQEHKTVHYQNIDCAIQLIKRLGKGSLLSKSDILHAYKVVPVRKNSYKYLGFKIENAYYYDKTLAMGLAVSCQWFEGLSNALHWVLEQNFGAKGVVHILDDILFNGPPNTEHCYQTLNIFCLFAKQLAFQ